jgi:hypothetical protein
MRGPDWTLASWAVLGAILSCKGPASSSLDASPPEVASELRGGGPDLPDAAAQPCIIKGSDPATAAALKVQLEAKVNAGTATDREIRTLAGLCVCLEDRPCVEWANVVDSQGWRALDGAVVKIVR